MEGIIQSDHDFLVSAGPAAPAPVSAQPLERSNFLEAASTQIHPCCTEANHHQTSDAVAISEAPFPSQAGDDVRHKHVAGPCGLEV